MNVSELADALRHYPGVQPVAIASDCCGCAGDDLEIEDDGDTLWIIDRHRRPSGPPVVEEPVDDGPVPPPPPEWPARWPGWTAP